MNGFFQRLAQRTLGTAQTVRPFITPRFARNLAETENANPIPEIGRPPEEPNLNAVHNNKPASRATQTEAPQKNHRASRVPEQQTQGGQHLNVTNSIRAEPLSPIDPVKPNTDDKNQIETPRIPHDIEPRIISSTHSHRLAEPVLASERSPEKRSLEEAPLVPLPVGRSPSPEHSTTRFENFGNPGNVPLNSGQQSLQSTAILKPQGLDESRTINVSIGRVEVRAVHPQPAPIKTERVKTKSTLSLEDYLQQRRNGER